MMFACLIFTMLSLDAGVVVVADALRCERLFTSVAPKTHVPVLIIYLQIPSLTLCPSYPSARSIYCFVLFPTITICRERR